MNFYTSVIQADPRFTSTARISDLALLEPITRTAVQSIITEAAAMSLPVEPFETFRSDARQAMLFNEKATKLRQVGVHHFGLACDLVRVVQGEPNWKVDYSFLLILARKYGLISGQDWGQPNVKHTFIDADHVQRIAVSQQGALFAGKWYPNDAYNPYDVQTQGAIA
jgi:hypothetical protein